MQLVMLAAGRGTRFGGLKQIAPVGPRGEALMDFTVRAAEQTGFGGVVLVVNEESRRQLVDHAARAWPASLPVEAVVQREATGTVPAVLAARPVLEGPFVVANADDLYEAKVLGQLGNELGDGADGGAPPHVLACYQLVRTILTSDPVKRGLCVEGPESGLSDIVEHYVRLRHDGRFDAWPLVEPPGGAEVRMLEGPEPVSMNLWGFHPRILTHLEEALDARAGERELLLPDVLGELVRCRAESVRLCPTDSRCIGLTHRHDLVPLREQLATFGVLDGLQS